MADGARKTILVIGGALVAVLVGALGGWYARGILHPDPPPLMYQTESDTGTIFSVADRVHLGARHAEHQVDSAALAGAIALLAQQDGLLELHDPQFGMSNVVMRARECVGQIVVADQVFQSVHSPSVQGSNPWVLNFTAGTQQKSIACYAQDDFLAVNAGMNAFQGLVPQGSTMTRLDLEVLTAPTGKRWMLVKLVLLKPPVSTDGCSDHE